MPRQVLEELKRGENTTQYLKIFEQNRADLESLGAKPAKKNIVCHLGPGSWMMHTVIAGDDVASYMYWGCLSSWFRLFRRIILTHSFSCSRGGSRPVPSLTVPLYPPGIAPDQGWVGSVDKQAEVLQGKPSPPLYEMYDPQLNVRCIGILGNRGCCGIVHSFAPSSPPKIPRIKLHARCHTSTKCTTDYARCHIHPYC